jgi:hypothetical protein
MPIDQLGECAPADASPAASCIKVSLIFAQLRKGNRVWDLNANPNPSPLNRNALKAMPSGSREH